MTEPATGESPFDLANASAYRRWREWKLDLAPRRIEDLVVPVKDPLVLAADEREALLARCQQANMALYLSAAVRDDAAVPAAIGRQLGLQRLDANWLADEDGISRVRVVDGGDQPAYIPYTTLPIRWHTDGYYNPPPQQIRGMVLHCVRPASEGGVNALLDHELAYLHLRDHDPALVAALSRPGAMTIPARTDADGEARAAQSGPVFSIDAAGHLHMRYTARTRSVVWADDPAVTTATRWLTAFLDSASAPVFRLRLAAGMGLVCNNVLHDRSRFVDDPARPRLLFRARYLDRVSAPTRAFADEVDGRVTA